MTFFIFAFQSYLFNRKETTTISNIRHYGAVELFTVLAFPRFNFSRPLPSESIESIHTHTQKKNKVREPVLKKLLYKKCVRLLQPIDKNSTAYCKSSFLSLLYLLISSYRM